MTSNYINYYFASYRLRQEQEKTKEEMKQIKLVNPYAKVSHLSAKLSGISYKLKKLKRIYNVRL